MKQCKWLPQDSCDSAGDDAPMAGTVALANDASEGAGLTPRLLAAVGLAAAAGIAPAWAQQEAFTLAPITVEGNSLYEMKSTEETGGYAARAATVGTKTPATLRSIPQSVSVVTRDVIEDRNYTTLDELARGTPGLRVLSNDMGRSSIYARGYEYLEYNINGLPAPMASISGTLPNLVAFDRVEILRGPSGLFNATSAMGGIINLVLKKPTETFQGHAVGRYGSWNQYFGALDVSGPLTASGNVRGRLVAAKKGSDGFPEGNEVGSDTIYGALEFDLTEDTLLSLGLLRQSRDIVPNNGVPTDPQGNLLYNYSDSTFFGADWNNFEMESYDVIAELTHEFDNGGHGHVGVRYSDRQGTTNYIFAGSALTNGKTSISGLARDYDQTALSLDANYSQTFEAFGNVSEYVVGADYKRYETDVVASRVRGLDVLAPAGPDEIGAHGFRTYPYVDLMGMGRFSDTYTDVESYGLYSKLTFRPIASLALIGGARLAAHEVQYTDHNNQVTHTRDDSAEITPYFGLVYDLNAHHSLYASYSTVYKPQDAVDINGELLEPREGEQYELGIKSSYFAGALNARFTVFHLQDENTAVPAQNRSYSLPIGKREVQGAEVEVTGSPTPNWDIVFGYTYLDTEVQVGTRRNEAIFLLMPEHRANLWAQYHFTGGSLEGLRLGLGVTVVGDFKSIQGIEAPSYVVTNVMAGYQFTDKLAVQLNINNILDEEFYTRVGSKGTFNMRGEPVNAVASLRYDF